jgi:hypothetical protein
VATVLCSLVLRRVLRDRQRLIFGPVVLWMLVYAGAVAISMLTPYDRVATLAALAGYLREVVIVFIVVNIVRDVPGLRLATWSLILGGVVLVGAGVIQVLTGQDFGGLSSLGTQRTWEQHSIRLDGPRGVDNNYFSQLLVTSMPLALYRVWSEPLQPLRYAAYGAFTLVGGAVIWTFSRAGTLGMLSALAVAALFQRRRPRRLLPVVAALVLVFAASPRAYWDRLGQTIEYVTARYPSPSSPSSVASIPAPSAAIPVPSTQANQAAGASRGESPPGGTPRPPSATPVPSPVAARTIPLTAQDSSVDGRLTALRIGGLMWRDHPLTGVGKGNYYRAYSDYYWRVDPQFKSIPTATHNTYAQIAAETGLLGLVAFLGVLVAIVTGLRSARRRSAEAGLPAMVMLLQAIEVSLYGYLVTSLFLHDNVYQRCLWLLVGLAAAGIQIAGRQSVQTSLDSSPS